MADQIGIKVNPDVFGMLFHIGAKIASEGEDLTIRLVENGIPKEMIMVDFGFNRKEGQFFFVFREQGDQAPGPISWRAPVYEKVE